MPIATPDPVAHAKAAGAGHQPGDVGGLGDTIVQVVDDGKAYAAAQVALYKALALARWRIAQGGLIFAAVAAVLGLSAVTALLVGLILSLAPLIGPLGATAVVILATLVIAGVLGWLAARRIGEAMGTIE
jgi:hypothetical protein